MPAEVGPLRTTWVAAHCGQGGTGVDSGVARIIPAGYDYAARMATTKNVKYGVLTLKIYINKVPDNGKYYVFSLHFDEYLVAFLH